MLPRQPAAQFWLALTRCRAVQDLAYYESPPGVQMLHCLRFDDSVEGGESTFMDAHAAAERLRQVRPPVQAQRHRTDGPRAWCAA